MENKTENTIKKANAASLKAIKASYQKVVRNMRGGPWVGCTPD